MATRKKPKGKKVKKKSKPRTRSNPESEPDAAGTESATVDPPAPPPADEPEVFTEPPEPQVIATAPAPAPDPVIFREPPEPADTPEASQEDPTGAPMFSISEVLETLPEEQLRALIRSDRVKSMIETEYDDDAERREEIDKLFAMVDGLHPSQRHQATFQVWRMKPPFHRGVRTEGFCDNFHPPFSLFDIRERFGGGVYEIRLHLPGENKGQQLPADERRVAEVSLVGEPVVYSLERDSNAGKGVQLDPKIQISMDAIKEEVVGLKAELQSQSKEDKAPSFMEKVMADAMPALIERIMNPPKPEPPPPPPPPVVGPTMLEQLDLVERINQMVLARIPSSSDTSSDDDSDITRFRKGLEELKGSAELLRGFWSDISVDKTKETGQTPGGLSEAEKKMHKEKSEMLLAEFVDVCWLHLMQPNQTADNTAAELHKWINEKVPTLYQGWFKGYLTQEYVLGFLSDRSNNDPARIARLESERGQKMVGSIVTKLVALMNGST